MNRRVKVYDNENEYLYTSQTLNRDLHVGTKEWRLVFSLLSLYNNNVIDKSEEVIIGDWIYTWENDE